MLVAEEEHAGAGVVELVHGGEVGHLAKIPAAAASSRWNGAAATASGSRRNGAAATASGSRRNGAAATASGSRRNGAAATASGSRRNGAAASPGGPQPETVKHTCSLALPAGGQHPLALFPPPVTVQHSTLDRLWQTEGRPDLSLSAGHHKALTLGR